MRFSSSTATTHRLEAVRIEIGAATIAHTKTQERWRPFSGVTSLPGEQRIIIALSPGEQRIIVPFSRPHISFLYRLAHNHGIGTSLL